MNQDILNKGIQDLQKITLSEGEKKMILNQVMQAPIASPYAPTISVWSFFRIQRVFVGALLAVFVLTSTTLAYASENALPGDLLYPVKIHVTEPIRDVLAVGAPSRAKWEATKAMRRLTEAEDLAGKNKLTPEYRGRIEKEFDKHIAAYKDIIKSVSTSTREKEGLDSFFNDSIKKHKNTLKNIGSHKKDKELEEINLLEETVTKNDTEKESTEIEDKSTSSESWHKDGRRD